VPRILFSTDINFFRQGGRFFVGKIMNI
jgi:hypothetical protein